MLRGEFAEAGETTPEGLLAAYGRVLQETLEANGAEGSPEIDGAAISAVREGTPGSLSLTEAAAILALDPDRPDGETIAAEARDVLLMGMTTAVLDVETLAGAVDDELEPKEIQQKIEGRFPMTLSEYALLHHTIAARTV